MAARHLSFYSSGDNSPIDSNPLVPCAAGIRYIPKVQRPVLPPNLFDCPCRLGDSCSDIWCLYAGWNFGVRPCASVNISRVWGRHAPTRALRKLTWVEEVKSRMDKKFSRIENLWPRDDSCSHTFTLFVLFFLESLSFFRYNKIERRWAQWFCNTM